MKYVIEQFKWDEDNGLRYYHLTDSKEFETQMNIPERSYHKNGSYFTVTKITNEIQTSTRRTKTRHL